eukprot:scaffold674232_cov60-Prasinocladus_malaysianus.AAC.1
MRQCLREKTNAAGDGHELCDTLCSDCVNSRPYLLQCNIMHNVTLSNYLGAYSLTILHCGNPKTAMWTLHNIYLCHITVFAPSYRPTMAIILDDSNIDEQHSKYIG